MRKDGIVCQNFDYEDELDLLGVVAVKERFDESEHQAEVRLHDNQTGALKRVIPLDEPWCTVVLKARPNDCQSGLIFNDYSIALTLERMFFFNNGKLMKLSVFAIKLSLPW